MHSPTAPNVSLTGWWRSRYGRQLLVEIAICGGLLMLYRTIRSFTKTDLSAAFANARDIVALEAWLGLPFEDNLQQFLLDHPTIIQGLNYYYVVFHFPAAIALLLWLYFWHGTRYRGVRNLMAFVTFAALVIHLAFPLAPPRMMSGLGFVDTMRVYGPNIYPRNALEGAANQIAAMPSLHFGWAMIIAIAVIMVLASPWRFLIIIHPVLMTLAIIATANHWWIDAAAAAFIVAGGFALGRLVGGESHNRSWNHGAEGPTDDRDVRALRDRQRRNFVTTLLLSQGVPMLSGGDELGRTQDGNNNAYCQDNEMSWYPWGDVDVEFVAWCQRVIAFRAAHPAFRRRQWFQGRLIRGIEDLAWTRPDGEEMTDEDWDTGFARAVGVFINGRTIPTPDAYGEKIVDDTFLVIFNASDQDLSWTIPAASWGRRWVVDLDTADPRRGLGRAIVARPGDGFPVISRSMVVLRSTGGS